MKSFLCAALLVASALACAEDYSIESDSVLITIILKHQQDKSLAELQELQDKNQFWQSFPPAGMAIESWYVVMGLGQVITLRVAPRDLRKLNLAVEKTAWGAFTTEIYPTYEFQEIAKQIKATKSVN